MTLKCDPRLSQHWANKPGVFRSGPAHKNSFQIRAWVNLATEFILSTAEIKSDISVLNRWKAFNKTFINTLPEKWSWGMLLMTLKNGLECKALFTQLKNKRLGTVWTQLADDRNKHCPVERETLS